MKQFINVIPNQIRKPINNTLRHPNKKVDNGDDEKQTKAEKITQDIENFEGEVDSLGESIKDKKPFEALLSITKMLFEGAALLGLQVNPLLGIPVAVIGVVYKIVKILTGKSDDEEAIIKKMDQYLSKLGLTHAQGALNLLYNTILVESRLMEEWRRENYAYDDITSQDHKKILDELTNKDKEIYSKDDVEYVMRKFTKPDNIQKWKNQLINILKNRRELQKMKDLDKETLDRHKNLIIEDWKNARTECGKNFEAFIEDFKQKRDPKFKYDKKKIFEEFKDFLYIFLTRSIYFRMVAQLVGNPEKLGFLNTTGDAILRKLQLHEDYVLNRLGVLFNAGFDAKHVLCGIYTDKESAELINIIESLGSQRKLKPKFNKGTVRITCLGSDRCLALKKKDVYTVESKKWDTYTFLNVEEVSYNDLHVLKNQNGDKIERRILSVNTSEGHFFVLADPRKTEECWYNGTEKKNNTKKVTSNDKPWDKCCLWKIEYTNSKTQNLNTLTTKRTRLTVIVNGATGLPKMDLYSDSDPYVKVIFKGIKHNEFKTPVMKDNHNPVWTKDNQFSIELTETQKKKLQFIEFHVWDDDSEDNDRIENNKDSNNDDEDDYIGCVTIHDPFDVKYNKETMLAIKKRYNIEYKSSGMLSIRIIYEEFDSTARNY